MSLYKVLKDNNRHFNIKYYPPGDLSYGYNLQQIINALNEINNYFENYNYELNDDVFKDFLICFEWVKYNKDKKYIKKENKNQLDLLLKIINKVYKSFDRQSILEYAEEHLIFQEKERELVSIFYEFLLSNKNKIGRNLLKTHLSLIKYYIINDYKEWVNILIKFNLYDDLLIYFKDLCSSYLEKVLKLIKTLKDNNIDISDYIKELNQMMDECLNCDIKDALCDSITYNTILTYYKLMKLPEANVYENKQNIINKKQDEWMTLNGQELKTDLQIDKIIKQINQIQNAGLQIIYYTHESVEKNGKKELLSFFESAKIISQKDRPVMLEFCSTNLPVSKTYDVWLQQCYTLVEILHLNILSYVFNSKGLKEKYFNGMKFFINAIAKGYDKESDINEKFNIVLDKIKQSIEMENENCIIYKDCCKSCVEFIEYLARELYYEIYKKEKYVEREKLTIGDLFISDKNYFKDVLTKDFIDGMRFYLSSETNEKGIKVGLDLRNRMSHSNGMLDNEYNMALFIRVTLIMTTFINQLYLYVSLK